jgi:hypothetical protein
MNSTTQIHNKKTALSACQIEPGCIIHVGAERRRSSSSSFDILLLETVDSVFSALGGTCKEAICAALEAGYGLKRDAIPRNVKAFAQALEDIFGKASLLLEAKIIHTLHRRVNTFKFHPEGRELSFVDYLESMRRMFE